MSGLFTGLNAPEWALLFPCRPAISPFAPLCDLTVLMQGHHNLYDECIPTDTGRRAVYSNNSPIIVPKKT